MNTLVEQVQHLVDTVKPVQRTTILKKNVELYKQVEEYYGVTIPEKLYTILNGEQHECPYGQAKKFLSLARGYADCELPCQCVEDKAERTRIEEEEAATKLALELEEAKVAAEAEVVRLAELAALEEASKPTIENHAALYSDEAEYIREVPTHVEETLRESTKIRISKKTGLPKG